MEKDKKLFLGIIFVLIAFVIFVSVLAFQEKKKKWEMYLQMLLLLKKSMNL